MSPVKALAAAIVAGSGVVGASFGVSAGVRHFLPPPPAHAGKAAKGSGGDPSAPVNPAVAIAAGKTVYTANCVSCHGANGVGGYAPPMKNTDQTDTEIRKIVISGVSGKMPAFKNKLSEGDMKALFAYIRSLK